MRYVIAKRILILSLLFSPIILSAQNVQLIVEGNLTLQKDAADGLLFQSDAVGNGSWVKPVYQQRKVIDVTDFGAISDQDFDLTNFANQIHTVDNTLAFQAAIDSAATFGGTVFIPAGNYVISQKLTIPSGVTLQGASQGGDYHSFFNTVRGSCLIYTGLDYLLEFRGFFSGAKDLYFYNAGATGFSARGCINVVADDGLFSTGYLTFSRLFIHRFLDGTCIKLTATNNSTIGHVLVEDVILRFQKTGMHIDVGEGSRVQHVTLFNGKIGGGLDYSFRNQGGTNINVFGTTFEGIACNSKGHLVVESGNINIYGFRTESTDSEGSCDESQILIAHFFPNTNGSYVQGILGEGLVRDEGANYLDVAGKNTGIRPSGNNVFENSAFRGVQNGRIPDWELTGNTNAINVSSPIFTENNQVLELTIPAGEIVTLSPTSENMPKALRHQFCSFGAYIKTATKDMAFSSINAYSNATNTCSDIHSVFHSGDNQWQYIGLPGSLNSSTCSIDAQFIFDNSNNGSVATVSITVPTFVFGNTRPSVVAKPLLKSGGKMNGTLTAGMLTLPLVVNSSYELTLPMDGNTFLLQGVSPIQRLNNNTTLGSRFPKGTVITLLFDAAGVVVKNWAYIGLIGSGDYISTSGSSLTLVALADGTWREVGRNL